MSLLLSPRRYPPRLAPILALLVVAGCGGSHRQHQPRPRTDVTVTVRLSHALPGRNSTSGFLHGLTRSRPADALVAPLEPRFWRSDLFRAPMERAIALGARYELVLSDLWGYPHDRWRGRGPPWDHLPRWRALVRHLARLLQGRRVLFDVWNEPDGHSFFGGGLRRFLRVYATAAGAIRQELGPGARIGGPSTSHYRPRWLAALVRCCHPDFLSWHATDPALAAGDITRQLRAVRARLGVRALQINEFGSPVDRYQPGKTVGYLAAIESGGADAAARTCWPNAACGPGRLDGLLTPAGRPRAVWWAQRWYALTPPATRVASAVSDSRVVALASRGRPSRVLLGRAESGARGPVDVAVVLSGLRGSRVHVRVEGLPDDGGAALARPQRLSEAELRVDHGRARALVRGLGPHEAALVTADPSGGG
jgi:Glycosyl hydrolases family 39